MLLFYKLVLLFNWKNNFHFKSLCIGVESLWRNFVFVFLWNLVSFFTFYPFFFFSKKFITETKIPQWTTKHFRGRPWNSVFWISSWGNGHGARPSGNQSREFSYGAWPSGGQLLNSFLGGQLWSSISRGRLVCEGICSCMYFVLT